MADREHTALMDTRAVVRMIRQEASRRPVVPFLGAGVSISAGFPTIRFVVQYLAKVDFAIRLRVFEERFPSLAGGHEAAETYRRHPSKYLEDFGWPDLGQLDADLWMWLGRSQKDERYARHYGEGRHRVWEESRQKFPGRGDPRAPVFDLLSNDITGDLLWDPGTGGQPPVKLDPRDHLRAVVQWTLRQDLADREGGAARATLREWRRWKRWYDGNGVKEPELLYGDWEALLDRLCEGSFDLTDVLFTSFEHGRQPTLSHRYLAFLQRKLGIPLVLTTNFDSLLERAMREEGVSPKVFDVHRDAELPDPALVRRQFSVLKLHGSAYGLRLGERLRYPLDADARSDALQYIPRDALVLVMGFSGSERRIMQLLQAVARDDAPGRGRIRLVWIQGPGRPGLLFNELISDPEERVKYCVVRHVDTFLQELYFHFANSYQASAQGYATLPGRPGAVGLRLPPGEVSPPPDASPDDLRRARNLARRPVQVCIAASQATVRRSTSWASMAGAAFIADLDFGYTVVWIDLENHHTVEGIVAEFFDKVRLVDPQAPTCTLTDLHTDARAAIEKAVARIREVFQRGRYVLVLDSVESFGRPQMMHHGIPSYDIFRLAPEDSAYGQRRVALETEFSGRVNNLKLFLESLLGTESNTARDPSDNPFWDSYVVVTVDEPRLRYRTHDSTGTKQPRTFQLVRDELIAPLLKLDTGKFEHVCVHRQLFPGYKGLLAPDLTPETADPSEKLPDHWRYQPTVGSQQGASIRRAGDIVELLHELRTNRPAAPPGPDASTALPGPPDGSRPDRPEFPFSKGATAAFVALLSMFRRSRTLPMLRSIVERWGLRALTGATTSVMARNAHASIDDLLAKISTRTSPVGLVAQLHEGATVWLFREVHEATYDALTECLHTRDWIAAWHEGGVGGTPSGVTRSGALTDGMISITWHLYAARTYYADVFMPTRDIRAFYEYLYHRVAATRTITLLIAIIEADKRGAWRDLGEALAQVAVLPGSAGIGCHDLGPIGWFAQVIGIFAAVTSPDATPTHGAGLRDAIPDVACLLVLLNDLRRHALETLLMALTRNRLLLRAVATPDTVLAWSRQFLDRELDDIQGTAIRECVGGRAGKALYGRVTPREAVEESINALRDLFDELRFQARLSKLDFEGALKADAESAGVSAGDFPDQIRELIGVRARAFGAAVDRKKHTHDAPLKQACSELLRTSRCLIHLRNSGVVELTEVALRGIKTVDGADDSTRRVWAKKQRRNALELRCKSRFAAWPLWAPLLDRSGCDSRETAPELRSAEAESVAYEDTLRETSDTNEDDARHRSSALALRSRALYLRGHFRQAHHFLDLASAGLHPERLDHRTAIAVIHLLRAELLAISADEHYRFGSRHDQTEVKLDPAKSTFSAFARCVTLPAAAACLKKIERAEQELSRAELAIRGMAHQNIWVIPLEFGRAQLRLERMVFEAEALYWSGHGLTVTEYLQRNGSLEQFILEGMRSLRGVLDMIPYRSGTWEAEVGRSPTLSTSLQAELMLYQLWRQFFVAGAFYSGLLSDRHASGPLREPPTSTASSVCETQIPSLTGCALIGHNAIRYQERWRLWCAAMRFEHFGANVGLAKSLNPGQPTASVPRTDLLAFRAAIIQAMRDACREEEITLMWNIRRKKLGRQV